MTNEEALKQLNGKRFYSDLYGDMVTTQSVTVVCDDGRIDFINSEKDFKILLKESGIEEEQK